MFLHYKNHEGIYNKVIVKTSIQFSLDKDVSVQKKLKIPSGEPII